MNTETLPRIYFDDPDQQAIWNEPKRANSISANTVHLILIALSIIGASLVGTVVAVFGVIDVFVSILGVFG